MDPTSSWTIWAKAKTRTDRGEGDVQLHLHTPGLVPVLVSFAAIYLIYLNRGGRSGGGGPPWHDLDAHFRRMVRLLKRWWDQFRNRRDGADLARPSAETLSFWMSRPAPRRLHSLDGRRRKADL